MDYGVKDSMNMGACMAPAAASLIAAGYVRVEMVEAAGQFAMRGGIIDVYPSFASF